MQLMVPTSSRLPSCLAGCLSPESLFTSTGPDCRTWTPPGPPRCLAGLEWFCRFTQESQRDDGALNFYLVTVKFGGSRRVAPQCGGRERDALKGRKSRQKKKVVKKTQDSILCSWICGAAWGRLLLTIYTIT